MERESKKRTVDVKEGENEIDTKKAKVFCGRDFRKELNKGNLISSLKNFLNLAQQHDDGQIVFEYLQAGGSVQEMLLLLDQTAKTDLTSALPVFKVLHLIFTSIRSSDSEFYAQAKDGAKFMLDTFMPTIEAMININSNKHRKVVLKVLTSVVTLFPSFARDIVTLIPNSPTILSQFLRPQSGRESLRSWLIFFILSFIVGGDITLIQTIFSMKGLLADIMSDLEFDEAHTVNVFLSVMQEKVLENVKVTKTLKLKVFNTQVVTSLFKVYNWKGPKNITVGASSTKKGNKEKEVNPEEKELVTESIHNFLTVLCTSKKFGIVFTDYSFGTYGESKNNLLCTVLQSIPEPWENKKMSEIVIKMIVTCPDLMNVILRRIDSSIQPQSSKKWNNLLQFVERLLQAISPKDILMEAAKVSDIDLVQLSKQFCTPAVLIQKLSLGLQNKTCFPVLYYSMRVSSLMWRNTEEVLASFGSHERLKKTLTSSFNNCLQDINDILDLWKNICRSPTAFGFTDKKNFLDVILNFLEMNSKCDNSILDSPNWVASEMLETLDAIRVSLGDADFIDLQSKVFYLVTWVDPMSITPDTDLFRKAMVFLFQNKSRSTIESLTKIILSTGVFENCESEIDIWLACYFDRFGEYRDFIPIIFTDCVCQLYLKEVSFDQNCIRELSNRVSVLQELMEVDSSELLNKKWISALRETPTPMLMQLLELLKNSSSSWSKKEKEEAQNYINHVAFRLFQYYKNSEALKKFCLQYKNEFNDSVFAYITGSRRTPILNDDTIFQTTVEKELMAWILKQRKNFDFENTFSKETRSSLALFVIFNTVVSYLLTQVNENCLSNEDVSKFSRCFSYFLNLGSKEEKPICTRSNILSYNIDNLNFLRGKCIRCIFSVPLADKFDLCEYENRTVMNFSKFMASVIMEMNKEELTDFTPIFPWREVFLRKISNLQDNNKTLEIFGTVEQLVDRFHYSANEISSILNEYCNITDIKIFVTEGELTMSTMILTKFIKLQCDQSEVEVKGVRQLWNIIKYMNEANSNNFGTIDDCFIYILKKRPKSLSLIDNDFFEWFLKRTDFSEETVLLGNLLLSDPNKVKYFITFAKDNFKDLKNKKIIIAMLAVLIQKEDKFSDLLRFHRFCCYWKKSELFSEEENSDIFRLMKLIHKKYRGYILNCNFEDMDFILNYSEFFSVLMERFLDKEKVLEMKENISRGVFLPEIIHKVVLKYHEVEDLVETYVQGLLILCYNKAKDMENEKCDNMAWEKFSKYICDFSCIEEHFNWSKIANSTLWKDFIRLSLRICFNFPKCPSFLRTVRCFFELLYKPDEKVPDVAVIFDMLISHSQFLGCMLQNSLLKEELVSLYYSIIFRNSEVLSVKHIPIILASYSASLSKTDVTLLNILKFYERNNIIMSDYEPLVWGEPAVSHYSVKSNIGVSLWRRVNMLNILDSLDSKRINVSLKEFPIYRTLKDGANATSYDQVYDPAFLLPIFANLFSPGAVTFCLPFVQKGCFAYTVCALSSLSKEIRIMASVVLARFYNHLELVQNMKLKSVWLHFINCLRYAVEKIEEIPLPSVVTYFLAKASIELSGEPGEMFTSLQKFLLAKPVFSFQYIPEFLPLFHSSDVQYLKHRQWLLEVLRDGFKLNVDLDLLFQTMGVKVILSYFRSQFCNRETKVLVLEVFISILKTDKSKLLISEYGFLTWLNAVALNCDQELFTPFVKLISLTMAATEKVMENESEKKNPMYPIQILNILMKILPNLRDYRVRDTHVMFLTIVLDCLMILLQLDHRNWCKTNKENLAELSRIAVKMTGDESLHERLSKSKFFLAFYDAPSNLERLHRKVMFLGDVLLSFR